MSTPHFTRSPLLDLEALKRRHHPALVMAAYGLVYGIVSIGLLGVAERYVRSPLVFPSLGPTAFLLVHKPLETSASPRNAILGHLIGAGAGYLSLLLFGLAGAAPADPFQMTWDRWSAAALSIGATIGLMELWDIPHPPAGATTLIVSLGLMSRLPQLGWVMVAVVLLVYLGFVINRLVGIPYPLWHRNGNRHGDSRR